MNNEIRKKLRLLLEEDKATRMKLLETGDLYGGYADEMQQVHIKNAEALSAIVDEYGWPGQSLVGTEGHRDAWMIAMHAICTPDLLLGFSDAIQRAFEAGEVPEMQAVLLRDQILHQQNKPQKCGWVFDWQPDGQMGCVVEDESQANILREKFGLPSLSEAIATARNNVVEEGGVMPGTYKQYRDKADSWRKSIGWI